MRSSIRASVLPRGRNEDVVTPARYQTLRTAAMSRLCAALDSDIVYSFRRSKITVTAACLLLVIVLAAALAPWITPHDPFDLQQLSLLDSHAPPAWMEGGDSRFLLGTDDQGRDVLSTIVHGTRISLAVGVFSVTLAAVLGVVLGLVAGYAGGAIDSLIMRIADVQLTFP